MAWVEVATKGNDLFDGIGDGLSSGSDSLYPTAVIKQVLYIILKGFRTKAMCVNGVCAANAVTGVTNACVYLCGQASCLNAVDPGVCDMAKLLPGYTGAKYTCINGNYYSAQFVLFL